VDFGEVVVFATFDLANFFVGNKQSICLFVFCFCFRNGCVPFCNGFGSVLQIFILICLGGFSVAGRRPFLG
jgi:hypothetical protein